MISVLVGAFLGLMSGLLVAFMSCEELRVGYRYFRFCNRFFLLAVSLFVSLLTLFGESSVLVCGVGVFALGLLNIYWKKFYVDVILFVLLVLLGLLVKEAMFAFLAGIGLFSLGLFTSTLVMVRYEIKKGSRSYN